MAYLALVRHGESDWNEKGLWTGWTDVDLTEKGREEARDAGEELKNIRFDRAFVSKLNRAHQTLDEIKSVLGYDIPTQQNVALNERDYGVYTGKNKWELKEKLGAELHQKIRRGWDTDIPEGENLKQVSERVIPYYKEDILPHLKKGENVLVSAHGNSLRALVKFLDNISDIDVEKLNIATGEIYLYEINKEGNIQNKKILSQNPQS